MSQENVEIVRQVVDAWNRRDYPAALERISPDIQVESALGAEFDATLEGIASVQKWLAGFWGAFVDFHSEIEECVPAGDDVVISIQHYGRGKTSGAEVEMRNWQVFTILEGKVVRYRLFKTLGEAFEAAGLSE
jgi:ketosteroid isomerase-like protein